MKLKRFKRPATCLAVAVVLFLIVAVILGRDGRHRLVGKAVLIDTDFGSSAAPIMNVVTGKPSTPSPA